MKSFKKLLAVLMTVAIIAGSLVVPVFADSLNYEEEARTLYDLGLFKGVSETEYKPNLEARLLREEAVALLLRMFKLEDEALSMDENEAKQILSEKFKDADQIASWAVKYVAYAVKNGIIAGRPDGNFAPKDNLLGREYAKMLLTMLGYVQGKDFEYEFSMSELANVSGFPQKEAVALDTEYLLRDDVVGMSYYTLTAEYVAGENAGKKVIEVIVGDDEEMRALAIEKGLIEKPVMVLVEELPDIEITQGDELVLPETVKVTYSDGTVKDVKVSWPNIDTNEPREKTEITGVLEGSDGKLFAKFNLTIKEAALRVTGVSADNLIEVVVTYNNNVEGNDAVKKKDNYKLNNGKSVTNVKVEGNTAILTLNSAPANQSKAKLTVSDKILGSNQDFEFTFFDGTLPDVLDIEITGPKSFDVTFSEPIKEPTAAELANIKITVKSGNSTITAKKASVSDIKGWGTRTLSIELYSSFAEDKEYNVTLENFFDYAGYKNIIRTFTFTYVKDTAAPVATIDEAKQEYVKVSFNKPVTGLTPAHFSHTFTAWTAMKLTTTDSFGGTAVTTSDSVKTVYVWFYNDGTDKENERPIREGETNFTILTKANNSEIKDAWGNKFVEATYTISVVADKTAPDVKEIKVTGEQTFTVEFTKNVAGFTTDNVEVLNTDGTTITGLNITITAESAKKFTVNLGKNMAGKSILVNIKNVKDNTLNANKLTLYTATLDITDKTPPEVSKVAYENVNNEAWYLYVFFNEEVDQDTALNANNYYIKNGTTYTKLTETAEFYTGNKIVKIKLTSSQKDLISVGTSELFVTNVKDVAGNEIAISDELKKIIEINNSANAPYIEKAEATAIDTVEVTFNEELATYDPSAFKVLKNGSDYAGISSLEPTLKDGKTKLILKIDTNLPYNPQDSGDNYEIKIVDTNAITNMINVNPASNIVKAIDDKIGPALVDSNPITAKADGKIAIKFTEPLSTSDVVYYALDLVVTRVSDGKTLTGGTDYTTSIDPMNADTLIVTITGLQADTKFKVASKDSITYIKDVRGNKAKAFTSAKEVTADLTAPTISKIEVSADKTKVTVTFSEAVQNAKADLDALKNEITIEDSASETVAISSVAIENGKLVINLSAALESGDYTLKITANALKDAVGNLNDALNGDFEVQ